jgi:hypothetical protein
MFEVCSIFLFCVFVFVADRVLRPVCWSLSPRAGPTSCLGAACSWWLRSGAGAWCLHQLSWLVLVKGFANVRACGRVPCAKRKRSGLPESQALLKDQANQIIIYLKLPS